MAQNENYQILKLVNTTEDNIFESLNGLNTVLLETYKYNVLPLTFWHCFQFSINHTRDPLFQSSFKNFVLESELSALHAVASPNFNIHPLRSGGVAISISNTEYADALSRANLVELLTENEYKSLESHNSPLNFNWDISITSRIVDGIFNGFHKIEKDDSLIGSFDSEWFISRFFYYASVAEEDVRKSLFQQICDSNLFPFAEMPYAVDNNIQMSILLNTQDRTDEFMHSESKCSELSIEQLRQNVFLLEWDKLARRFGFIFHNLSAAKVYLETLTKIMNMNMDDSI